MAQTMADDCGHASGSVSSGPAGAFASSFLTGCQVRPAAETRRLRTSEGRLRENIETTGSAAVPHVTFPAERRVLES